MAYNKNTWTDRVVERPMTFKMQQNTDGTVTLIPSEGKVIQSGSAISANKMNNLESQYEKIESIAQMMKLTDDNGGTKLTITDSTKDFLIELLNLGRGMHTFYAVTGTTNLPESNNSVRGIFHQTSLGYGWVIAWDYRNNVYTNYLDNNTWSGWKWLSSKMTTLWSGDSRGDFNSTFTLSESLTNYDFAYIKVNNISGTHSFDRFVQVASLGTTFDFVVESTNLADSPGSLGMAMQEYCATFAADQKSFKNIRATQMTLNSSNTLSRTDNYNGIGISRIVGIKL